MVAARFPDANSPRGELRVKPVGDGLVRIEMVVSTEVAERLEEARDIDRHRNPSGDVEAILGEALDLFVAKVEKRKFARVTKPREARSETTAGVPAAVRRAVNERDGGRCTFVGSERVCNERAFVEHDHVEPRAVGGEHSVENGAQLCATHNRRKAELDLGKDMVEGARRRVQRERDLVAAMVGLGFPKPEARARSKTALEQLGHGAPMERLCRVALR